MRKHFRLTPEAHADLREILLDIAEDSPDTAARLWGEFYQAFEQLGRCPGIGHYHEELYLWEKTPIEIVAVVHGARDLSAFWNLRMLPN